MKRRVCSYDMFAVPDPSFVLEDTVGEMYFCNLRCFCIWSVQLATRPNLSAEDKNGTYSLTTPSGEEHQSIGIVDVARWATATAFGPRLVATLGYAGSLGHHTILQSNSYVTSIAQAIPLNPLVNVVDLYGNNGASNYSALLLGLKHSMAHHFQLDAQFQWAKSMDNSSQPYYESPYPFNPSLAWAVPTTT